MERITVSIENELAEAFDMLVDRHGYASRSEAVRDLVRGWLSREALRIDRGSHCVAQIGFVSTHRDRTLTERIAATLHDHHDLVVSGTVVPLDHDDRLETVFARGETHAVRAFADRLIALRGVRHGSVSIIPVELSATDHGPQGTAQPHAHQHGDGPHLHLKPVA